MSVLSIPNAFTNGTPADATLVNANFNAVVGSVNNINSANIGVLGTYASQIIPTNTAQATFGGIFGYQIVCPAQFTPALAIEASVASSVGGVLSVAAVANQAGSVITAQMGTSQSGPGLLVNGAASITGNLLQVDLTSGGTHAMFLTSSAVLTLPLATATQTGLILGVASADSKNPLQIFTSGGFTQIGANSGVAVQTINGTALFIQTDAANLAAVDRTGNLGIAGTLHQVSKRAAKKNIQDLTFSPLAVICETNWQQYQLNADPDDKQPHIGFIADDSSEWLGGATREYLIPSDLAGIAASSVKELVLRLRAAGVAI